MPNTTNVSNHPQAHDDAFNATASGTFTFDVMANDLGGAGKHLYSLNQSNPVAVATSGTSAMGAQVSIVDGQVVYSANNAAISALAAGETVVDTFTYTIQMGNNGALSVATVSVTLTGLNDAPVVIGAVSGLAVEDGPAVTLNALANASDVDHGTVLQVASLPTTLPPGVSYDPASHSFTLDPSNTAYQSLAQGETTTVTVAYAVSDGITTTPDSVTWTVAGTNDAPVVSAAVTGAATEGGASVTLNALANATDVDHGAVLSVVNAPVSLPAGVSYDAATHSFSLDPTNGAYDHLAAGATQTVSVAYAVTDGIATTPASASWTITGTNDAASTSGLASGAVHEDGVLTASGVLSVTDPDDGEAHFQAPSSDALHGTYGTFTFTDGAWTYALNNGAANVQALNTGQTVHDTLVVTSADGTATQTIDVTIAGQNEPQLVQLLSNNSFEDGSISSTQIPGWTNLGGTFLEVVDRTFLGIGGDGHLLDTQGTPGGITIAQTIDVATGDHATLSFSLAAELTGSGLHPGSTLSFTWDGVVVKTITEDDFRDANGNMQWNTLKTFTVDVVGQAGADTLSIHDSGTALVGYALDWVKVQEWIVT
jgi:VCBS repeat-containing protein